VELTVVIRAEGEGYWSQVRELPGCFASARTLAELREALGEAVGIYLWDRPVALGDQTLRVGEVEIEIDRPAAG
jgi:predicted RNase H-like HicB family nuclease